jgi:tetratricopeptide (TPR) repeat protein
MTHGDDAERPATNGGPTNTIAGGVTGTSVQAGAIHGGVHVHHGGVAATPVPRQLKPVPVHFTGRVAETAELTRIAAAGGDGRRGPALAVITGQGGVGKSTLAARWLHGVAGDYPDGQLYTDLAPVAGGEPAELTSVVSGFLRAFGVPSERVPPELAEAAALFRSLTADKRLAVLLDNAASAAQVRVLLPASPGSVVVVATRWRLGGLAMDGAEFLPLVPLPPDAGAELLARSVGDRVRREPDAAAELVDLCGGLPIALSIAGARLAMRPRWPVSRVVRDLADEQRRLAALSVTGDMSVHSVFDLSYNGLPAREAQAYRRLGLHPGPSFTAGVAAAALDLPVDDAADALEALVDASLLDVNDAEVFRFHDLVRLHARACADRAESPADRTAVLTRTMRYYLRFAATADHAVNPLEPQLGPVFRELRGSAPAYPGAPAALDALEAELPNLMAVLHAGTQAGLDELVWQLCESMWSMFLRRKHFADWTAAHRLGVAAAARCADPAAESRMRQRLGLASHNLGRSDEAIGEGTAAVAAARTAGHAGTEVEALQLIGMAHRDRGRYDEALAFLRQSVDVAAAAGLPRGEVLGRRLLGQALTAADRLDEAVAELGRARELAAALGDEHVRANASVWLADALTRAGRVPEANALLEEAWATVRESGSAQHRAQLLAVRGRAAERGDDLVAARDLLRRARDLYAEIGAPHVTRVQGDLDRVEARLGPPPAPGGRSADRRP